MAQPNSDPEIGKDSVYIKQGPAKKCTIGFKGINYTVKLKNGTTKTILSNVSGAVAPGEVLAIMGPSGSGKTSLLDVLAHRIRSKKSSLKGIVHFNGKKEKRRARRKLMSYVSQEDSLMGVFTVRETLWFAARFYYGYNIEHKKVEEKIEGIIDSVGLRSAADTIVGNIFMKGLSGGQQRRLSMAIELIASPAILLLDEPTSGLDSASAYAIMTEMRSLASLGHTIICTIHQPSSEIWSKFDQFMLLAQGSVCYMGEASKAVAYFESIGYPCPPLFNPADFIINMVATDFDVQLFKRPTSLKELTDAYDASEIKKVAVSRVDQVSKLVSGVINVTTTELALEGETSAPSPVPNAATATSSEDMITEDDDDDEQKENLYRRCCVAGGGRAGFGSNFRTLVHRNLLNLVRNPGIIVVREAMYLMLAVFLGLTFLYMGRTYTSQTVVARNSLLFFVAAFWVFMSVAVIPFVEMERAVFLREKRNGAYTAAPYVLAHFVGLLPGTFLLASTTSLFIVFMSSLNGYGYFLLCLWMSLIYAECFVYFVASISPHYIIGIALAAGFFGLCMTVEGFFIVFNQIGWWIRWIGYITPHRYGFRAFMRNEYATISVPFTDPNNPSQVVFANGTAVLAFYGFEDPDLQIYSIGGDVGVMFAFACSYLLLFYLVCEFYWK